MICIMASSDFDTYSNLHAKSVFLSESALKIHNDTDDSKTVTLKCTPSANGNVDLQLPVAAGTLMSSGDDLDSRNLAHGENLVAVTPDDLDGFLVYDDSDSNNPKRVTGAALKTYVGSASLAPGDIDNSNLFAADVVNSAALAANAVAEAKIADGAVASAKLAVDAVVEAKIANNAVTDAKIQSAPSTAGTAEASKFVLLSAGKHCTGLGDLSMDHCKVSTGHNYYLGESSVDGSWRFGISGSGDIVFEKREAGVWNSKHVIN